MGSQQSTIDFVLDQMSAAGAVSAKKMFGEYGVYLDEKMVALVCDDVLFIKPTGAADPISGRLSRRHPTRVRNPVSRLTATCAKTGNG